MRRKQIVLVFATILTLAVAARGQEKEAPVEKKAPTALTVQVVFSEFEGDRKVSSLPYTMPVNAVEDRRGADWEQLRMGIKVPITGKEGGTQYMDVGTNIDALAVIKGGGEFEIQLRVERTSVYSADAGNKPVEWTSQGSLTISAQPIVRHYRSTMTLRMKDGQTMQRSLATDPLSGRVLRVDVTLNVVK